MAKMSPTQLTLRKLRSEGYTAAVTEHWNPYAKVRQDLFGIVDVLAVGNGETVAVQCTSDNGGNVSARCKKIADADAVPDMRKAGWRIIVQGWRKRKCDDNRVRWVCREMDCS